MVKVLPAKARALKDFVLAAFLMAVTKFLKNYFFGGGGGLFGFTIEGI